MIQLCYASRAKKALAAADVTTLVENARTYNAAHDVTGLLLYANGTFLHLLEGREELLHTLTRRIRDDERHTDVRKLFERPVMYRMFGAWPLAFRELTAAESAVWEKWLGGAQSASPEAWVRYFEQFKQSGRAA